VGAGGEELLLKQGGVDLNKDDFPHTWGKRVRDEFRGPGGGFLEKEVGGFLETGGGGMIRAERDYSGCVGIGNIFLPQGTTEYWVEN